MEQDAPEKDWSCIIGAPAEPAMAMVSEETTATNRAGSQTPSDLAVVDCPQHAELGWRRQPMSPVPELGDHAVLVSPRAWHSHMLKSLSGLQIF